MIKFTVNSDKALHVLLWILNKKPNIDVYNINKVMFAADCYSLNHFGRPIYGDRYIAMRLGTVPSFMYDLTKMKGPMPFYQSSKHGLSTYSSPNEDMFSEADIEALEYGMREYADLSFEDVRDKNHLHRAWLNHKDELKTRESVDIDFCEMIDNQEVLKDLQDLGSLTENMGF